jgi:hypothetical protein
VLPLAGVDTEADVVAAAAAAPLVGPARPDGEPVLPALLEVE